MADAPAVLPDKPEAPVTPAPTLDLGPKPGEQTPPKPPAGKEPPKEPTEGEKNALKNFANIFMTGERPKATADEIKEKKAKEAKEKAEKEKKETILKGKPGPKPKAKPVARKVEPPQPALTADQIAEASARGVAEAFAKNKPADKGTAAPSGPALSPEEQHKIGILEKMSEMFPDKYKDLPTQYKSSVAELAEYAAKWEQEHPGLTFNEDDEEHKPFFDTHDVDWNDDDYTEAVAEIRADKKFAEKNKGIDERLSKFERAEKLREATPKIIESQVTASKLLWPAFGKEFEGVIKENGDVDVEKLQELQKADPVGFAYRYQAARALDAESAEVYKVMNGLVEYDENNQIHRNMAEFASQQEERLLKADPQDQLDAEGRQFLPAAEYYKLPKAKRESLYWMLSPADISALRATHLAEMTGKIITAEEEKLTKMAEARGWRRDEKAQKATEQAPVNQEEPPEPPQRKPQTPSGGGESRMAAAKSGSGGGKPDALSAFALRQLGKS